MDRRKFIQSSLSATAAATISLHATSGNILFAKDANTSIRAISLDGKEIELSKAMIRELGSAMKGPVIMSNHKEYNTSRMLWNGMHDKKPALIARCLNTQDAATAIDFARDHGLLTAIRGGGHSWPGKSMCDDGIVVDLSHMTNVEIDVANKVAHTAGGALLGHLDAAANDKNLVTTAGVVSHTGVGGFTTGGGFGRLNRSYGLTIDNLLGAEIVTADGKTRYVSAEQEPDLFWAIRGGGGNFGAVTQFDFQLHDFDPNVLSGLIVWPVAQAKDVLEFYAEWQGTLSREMYAGPAMITLPDGTGVIAMEIVYNGNPKQGEKELAPLRKIGTIIDDSVKVQHYRVLQTHEDATVAHGIRSYAKNGMIGEFTQGLVNDMVDAYINDPRAAIFTHTAGGAVADVGETDTAFPHRNAQTMIVYFTGWMDPAQDEEGKAMCKQWHRALSAHHGGYYDNIEQETSGTVSTNYGPNYSRLRKIKSQYDGANQFRLNSNIQPL